MSKPHTEVIMRIPDTSLDDAHRNKKEFFFPAKLSDDITILDLCLSREEAERVLEIAVGLGHSGIKIAKKALSRGNENWIPVYIVYSIRQKGE